MKQFLIKAFIIADKKLQNMRNSLKYLAVGIIGGMLPLGGYLLLDNHKTNETLTFSDTNVSAPIHETTFSSSAPAIAGLDFTVASENSLHSVVHVNTKVERTTIRRDPFSEFFYGPGAGGREYKQYGEGSGSGVIVAQDGYIVTNNHVIADASEIEVVLNNNNKYTATVVGTDPSTDIAVLKIEAENLKAIEIGNSDDIKVGEWVLAVGNPFNLTSTVTAGIVSALGRNINIIEGQGNGAVPIESFIQTDAAVNPGNSGGALVNTNGELIGINTAIASQTGSYAGYSFAVPVNLVQKVMADLIDYGVVQRGYLGVQISDITQELKEAKELIDLKGIYVAGVVENSGSDKAGLEEGDVILKIGTREVNSVAKLQEEVGRRRPGDKIPVTIRNKKGYENVVEIVLRNKEGNTDLKSKEEIEKNTALGATFAELSSKDKEELKIENGVKITSITAGKLKSLGLYEGIVITKINNTSVNSVEELVQTLNKTNKGVLLEVITESGKKDYVGFGL